MSSRLWYILASGLGLVLDQTIKYGAAKLGWSFGSTFYLNSQFAWSWPLTNKGAATLSLTLLILGAFFYFKYWRAKPELSPIFLILSGAVSNILDRLIRGGVVDYLALPGGAMINLADIFIFAGIILLSFPRPLVPVKTGRESRK